MPDITMCRGDDCPKRETCYRFTAIPDQYWQSWFVETPEYKNGECHEYLADWRKVKEAGQ